MNAADFLHNFLIDGGFLALCVGDVTKPTFINAVPTDLPRDKDVYFSPAARKTKGNLKEDVLGSRAIWVDVDGTQGPLATIPPSAQVFSGHGHHLYWFLKDPLLDIDELEHTNRLMAKDVPGGDPACWNANRVLRVPGTMNCKDPNKPVEVQLKSAVPLFYTTEELRVVEKLDKTTKHKIRTGDSRGYRSRSERDWVIIVDLVRAGASDELIQTIFWHQPCGDKARESNSQYLPHTIGRARGESQEQQNDKSSSFEDRPDGYYMNTRRGVRRVSTFTIEPKILLDGHPFGAEDAIAGNVTASDFTWENISFTRSAFTSVTKMDKECPIAAWQWLGHDDDVRLLLPYLMMLLQQNGLPRVAATPTLGLHTVGGVPYFVGTDHVIGPNNIWTGYEGPIAWMPSKREHPILDLCFLDNMDSELARLANLVPKLNTPDVLWPMLGWYAASPLKPWLETRGYRFPVLNVAGTKGSGKTTLIQRIFMPLLGQIDPKSYDAGTTRFVTLALMGSSNAVPVAFSEFRYDSVEKFIRFVLLAYDTGHDPRGRGDQTTQDYPLSAPFSVDGEDLIEDPAARERIVVAQMHPKVVAEGSEAYEAYQQLRYTLPKGFGGYFISHIINLLASGETNDILDQCRDDMFKAFPSKLPDRVRANHTVAYFGCVLWSKVVGLEPPSPEVLRSSIKSVFDIDTGRTRTLVDGMIEDIANECSKGTERFRWSSSDDGSTLHFQLASAHAWWLESRRKQGRGALERDAIRAQLKESAYSKEPGMVDGSWMYAIDLQQAQQIGLDLPVKILRREMRIKF